MNQCGGVMGDDYGLQIINASSFLFFLFFFLNNRCFVLKK